VLFPGNEPVILSTSPEKPLTHWKHDLFVMYDVAHVNVGDRIKGAVRMTQNYYWKRHYDTEFSFSVAERQFYKFFGS